MEALAAAPPVDMFATKGIEYLLILIFLAAFLGFWLYFTSGDERTVKTKGKRINNPLEWFAVPKGVHFHRGHSWAKPETSDADTLKVGMDDFAQKMTGKVDFFYIGEAGAKMKQGEEGWTLKVRNKPITMLSPVNGEIIEVNEEVLADPSLINNDPYGKGWILKVRAENFVRDCRNLLSERSARIWMEEVTNKLRMKMGFDNGLIYQDGGVLLKEMARRIDEENWTVLLGEFLLTHKRRDKNDGAV
jgi:glycine cleavage system H lipoate-binding protein